MARFSLNYRSNKLPHATNTARTYCQPFDHLRSRPPPAATRVVLREYRLNQCEVFVVGGHSLLLNQRLRQGRLCIEAVKEALTRYAKPEIFNTNQGRQFSSRDSIKVLVAWEIRISMDGKSVGRDECLRRVLLLDYQIREGLSESLNQDSRGSYLNRVISRLLQTPTPTDIS
jgi:hypothetical protein